MEAPPPPEQAASEAHAESQQRRSSSRAARPAAGSLNVASLEQRYVSNDVFGGRRKAGQPRESLYVKGSEPENVVEITANTAIPELMQLTESIDPEAQKLSLSFLLNTDAPMADGPGDFAPIAAPPTPTPAPAAVSVPPPPPPPPPVAAEPVPLPTPAAPLTQVIANMLGAAPSRPRASKKRRPGPLPHEMVRTPPPVAPPRPARAKPTPTRRGREFSIPLNVEEVNHPESVALRDAAYWQNVIDKTDKEDDIERGFWKSAQEKWQEATFINCDLRYFNLAALGKFDVVLIDPPWRIKGNELLSSERRMFNNSTYQHSYGTLSNSEIIDIDVGCLCDKGFIFLWVINSQLMFGLECLKKWGYTYTDRIVWVRKNHNGNIAIGQGFYFLHSTETVLIGVKYAKGECLEFISKVSNDVIFAEIRERSRKPDQLYGIIERMCPGSRKIELFARNHNIRKGWLSLGNELGEYYDWDHDLINCDHCKQPIKVGTTRYKSRTVMDHDLCGKCLKELKANEDEYFEIDNTVPDMVFHEYFECDSCHTKPIWGIRFHCLECPNLDLCEACYDAKFLPPSNPEHKSHIFKAIELPDLAGGMPVHRFRCAGCNVLPIIGYLFVCGVCAKLYLCQKCFFKKKQPRNHRSTHDMEIVCVSDTAGAVAKCDVCGVRPIPGDRFRCTSCYLYEICEECHAKGAEPPKHIIAHKPSHKFTRIKAEPIE